MIFAQNLAVMLTRKLQVTRIPSFVWRHTHFVHRLFKMTFVLKPSVLERATACLIVGWVLVDSARVMMVGVDQLTINVRKVRKIYIISLYVQNVWLEKVTTRILMYYSRPWYYYYVIKQWFKKASSILPEPFKYRTRFGKNLL